VLVIWAVKKFAKHQEAGANFVGGDEIVQKNHGRLDGLRPVIATTGHDALRREAGKGSARAA